MKLTNIELEVLERIKPRREEYLKIENVYQAIRKIIEEVLKEHNVDAKVTLQGSIAHDTWLSGEHDLDIFVLFPLEWSVEELKTRGFELLLESAKRIGYYEVRYAEHPYVRVKYNDVEADLVPAFNVRSSDQIRTAVDRTPLHTMYLEKVLTDELRDHIRLLKQFFKGVGVYGAEVKTKGFSGYLCELLVVAHGGFHETLNSISQWRPPVFINTLGDHGEFAKIRNIIRKKYPDSKLIVPDPVDPLRNTAAAVSEHSLAKAIIASKCYINHPAIGYFFPKRLMRDIDPIETIRDENRCIILVLFRRDFSNIPPDVLWGETYRVLDRLVKLLRNFDFNPIDWGAWSDEENNVVLAVEVETCHKPYPRLYTGPPYYAGHRVLDYIVKHVRRNSRGPWIRLDGVLLSMRERRYRDAASLIMERYMEFTVAPHFRGLKPMVLEPVDAMNIGLGEDFWVWLKGFIVKRPVWMEYCTG